MKQPVARLHCRILCCKVFVYALLFCTLRHFFCLNRNYRSRQDREHVSDAAEIKMINNNNNDVITACTGCLTPLLRHFSTGFSNSLSVLSLPPSITDYVMSGIYYTTLSSCKTKNKKRPLADTRH